MVAQRQVKEWKYRRKLEESSLDEAHEYKGAAPSL